MTREEFAEIVKTLKSAYTDQNFIPDQDAFNTWYVMLQDLTNKQCQMAVYRYVMKNKFKPSISEIRELAFPDDSKEGAQVFEQELMPVIRRGNWYAEEDFAKLSPIVKRFVGSPTTLSAWARDEQFNEGVTRAHFIKVYDAIRKKERELEIAPPHIRGALPQYEEPETPMLMDNQMWDKPFYAREKKQPTEEIERRLNAIIDMA